MTSDRTQENWAPVSTKAGTLPTFKSNMTHNKVPGVTAAILRNALKILARGSGDRRGACPFFDGVAFRRQ